MNHSVVAQQDCWKIWMGARCWRMLSKEGWEVSTRNQHSVASSVGSLCGGWSCSRLSHCWEAGGAPLPCPRCLWHWGGENKGGLRVEAGISSSQSSVVLLEVSLMWVAMAQSQQSQAHSFFPCQPEALGAAGLWLVALLVAHRSLLRVERWMQAGWMPGLSADKQPPPSIAAFLF